MSSLTPSDWNKIFNILDMSKTQREIAKEYGISHAYISIKYKEYNNKKKYNSKGITNDTRGKS